MSRRIVWSAAWLAVAAVGLGALASGDEIEPAAPVAATPGDATAPAGAGLDAVDAKAKAMQEDTAEALAILKAMSDFLAGKPALAFEAEVGWDSVQVTGQRIEFGGHRDVTVRRPDRARVDSQRRDGETATLYFDGQRISFDLTSDDAYVTLEKPGTLDEAFDYLTDEMDTPVPLGDLVNADLHGTVAPRIESGFWVGEATMNGVLCDQIALRNDRVDAQLWIEEGDRPVPHRIVITYRLAPGAPQFWADFDQWDFAPEVPDTLFQFTPREGTEQIPMWVALESRQEGENR
jgi:hypothetical protein